MAKGLPSGVAIEIPFDNAHFVKIAIHEVLVTLAEAVVLVFFVMWLFLRDLRYTLVPTVVIAVTLMGAFLALYACGLSINVFTMFGLVLAIGILVDDAIVVVESVHRVMEDEALPPREATRKAMSQIGGAIVGVTAVLTAVFVPMAFFPGGVGGIYRQFAVAMIASMLVSSFLALSLTPALCANLLKAHTQSVRQRDARRGILGFAARAASRFTSGFDRAARGYRGLTARMLRRIGPMLAVYAVLVGACGVLYWQMPGGFLPSQDEGQLQVMVQLPAGATQARTLRRGTTQEKILHAEPAIAQCHECDRLELFGQRSERGDGVRRTQGLGQARYRRTGPARPAQRKVRQDSGRQRRSAIAAFGAGARTFRRFRVPPRGSRRSGA